MLTREHGDRGASRTTAAPRTLTVRLTLGPTGWFHDPRPAAPPRWPTHDRPTGPSSAGRPRPVPGPAAGPRTGGDATCTALDVATRTPRAVASARSAVRPSPRSGSASRPA